MIKTVIICDHCKKECYDPAFHTTVKCSLWENNLDFCHVNCLTLWVKDRQKEIGNCA